MSPWVSMPSGADAARVAAAREADTAVSAIQCAVNLLRVTASSCREREVLRALGDELLRLRLLVEKLGRQ